MEPVNVKTGTVARMAAIPVFTHPSIFRIDILFTEKGY
jgi:hypothetical protein